MRKLIAKSNILVIALLLIACSNSKKEDPQPVDESAPLMNITSPLTGVSMSKGAFLILEGSFEDDMELKELKVSLSPPAEVKAVKGIEDPWTPASEIIPLTGKKQIIEAYKLFDEAVPLDCLSGTYILLLELVDAKDKVTSQTIDIVVLE